MSFLCFKFIKCSNYKPFVGPFDLMKQLFCIFNFQRLPYFVNYLFLILKRNSQILFDYMWVLSLKFRRNLIFLKQFPDISRIYQNMSMGLKFSLCSFFSMRQRVLYSSLFQSTFGSSSFNEWVENYFKKILKRVMTPTLPSSMSSRKTKCLGDQ